MRGKAKDVDRLLDRTLAEIRDGVMDAEAERATADRVWARVRDEIAAVAPDEADPRRIRDCADFRGLIPELLAGELSEAKSLLLQDHVGECLPCRKALKQARSGRYRPLPTAAPADRPTWVSRAAWSVAAAAVIFLAVFGLDWQGGVFAIQTGGVIHIESIEGEAFGASGDGNQPLQVGEKVDFQDVNAIRTAKDSRVLFRMADSSLVEMNERAELAVRERRPFWNRFGSKKNSDSVIDLDRGNIIVEAADQGRNHLYVDTSDASVAVTGTVFAVNHGVKGSRVSVIEGSVEVSVRDRHDSLGPGQQATSSRGLARVPIEEEIAWSQNAERHLTLLNELTKLTREIEQEIDGPGLRYSTRLLDLAPAETVIYIGVPNVSEAVSRAYELLQEKIAANDVLSEWWQESVAGSDAEEEIAEAMEKIRAYGAHLGDEIALTLQMNDSGDVEEPVVLAELTDPEAFRAFVEAEVQRYGAESDVRVLPRELELYLPSAEPEEVFLWIADDVLVVGPSLERIVAAAPVIGGGAENEFSATRFHGRLHDLYRDGLEWVVGVDLDRVVASSSSSPTELETLERTGLADMQHVIGVHEDRGDLAESRVVLTFSQARQGIAAWLAEPAPMGALDFVSRDANLAAAFVMEEPATMLDQLFELMGSSELDLQEQLDQFEAEEGIDIREDIAATLGGEFALAIDGPVLPKPSWKLVFEVYNPGQLQSTLEWAVGRLNRFAAEQDMQGFALEQATQNGQTFYQLKSLDTGISAHYMFVDGYLVAGVSRALLLRSLQFRDLGLTLTDSPSFRALLPTDGMVNFSGVFYQNLGNILGPLADRIGDAASRLSPDQQQLFEEIGSRTTPSLTVAYGEPERITIVNTSRGGIISSALGSFLRFDTLANMRELLGEAARAEGSDGHHEEHREIRGDARSQS